MNIKRKVSFLRGGMVIPLVIKDIAFGGEGVGRYQDQAIFVPYTAPGDEISVKIFDVKKRHAHGIIQDIIKPSPLRISPRCSYFTQCGGCDYQHLSYADQLAIKKMQIVETFRRIGSFPDPPVADVIPSPRPFNYRGKADFWLRRQGGRRGAAGFLRSRSRDIIDVERCEIIAESLNQALKGLREQLRKCPVNVDGQQVTAWAWGREIGANVTAAALNDTVLAKALLGQPLPSNLFSLPAGSGQVAAKKSFLRRDLTVEPCHDPNGCGCSAIIPDIRSVHANAEGNLAYCGDVVPRIVKGRTFLVPAQGFFQANLYLVEQLVDTVVAMCALTGRETVLDAYCGSGLFSMFLASAARRILGVELWMKAINCARDNLAKAGYDNADFIAGDVGDVMESRLIASGQSFDVLLLDPPRTGCQGKVISSIKEMKPKRIVYVSCNPATLARDCRFLAEHGYILQSLQPFDMFPQTGHTEVVALLLLPD